MLRPTERDAWNSVLEQRPRLGVFGGPLPAPLRKNDRMDDRQSAPAGVVGFGTAHDQRRKDARDYLAIGMSTQKDLASGD
jgi:hypothetical protein